VKAHAAGQLTSDRPNRRTEERREREETQQDRSCIQLKSSSFI